MALENELNKKNRGSNRVMRVLRKVWIVLASVVLVFSAYQWYWKMSGSNQWELDIDKDGVKVYSLKAPGHMNKRFKGVIHYPYTITHMVAAMVDNNNLQNCKDWLPGCVDYETLNQFNTQTLTDTQFLTLALFPPFKHRESIVNGSLVQDPATKSVYIEYVAAPSRLPPNDCCFRIEHFHNTWTYTADPAGGIEVIHTQDFNLGGFFPTSLISLFQAQEVHKFLTTDLPGLLDNEKYLNARLDFIDDPQLPPATAFSGQLGE